MRWLRAIGLYAVLTVALTWPFASNLRVMDAGDSAFFAWEIGWTVHALETDPGSLPHGNIFHPLRYTLGMDEPVFGTTLLVYAVDDDDESRPTFSCQATPEQLRVLAERIEVVVNAGRPLCPLCGEPIDRSGHHCIRANGHRKQPVPPLTEEEPDQE